MSLSFDRETERLTEVLQHAAEALLEHIQTRSVIVPLDKQSSAYLIVGDYAALTRLCRVITPGRHVDAPY